MTEVLIRRKEAADALGISVVYLDILTKRGDVRCTRLGRRVLYCPADITRFVEQRREETRRA